MFIQVLNVNYFVLQLNVVLVKYVNESKLINYRGTSAKLDVWCSQIGCVYKFVK